MLSTGISSLLTDLGFIPKLGFLTTLSCNGLILSLDVSHYFVHVQAAVVVYLHNDRYVFDLALELSQFLHKKCRLRFSACNKGNTPKKKPTIRLSYRIIHGSEELDLILQGIYFCLQFDLVHVGSIYVLRILGQEKQSQVRGRQSEGKKRGSGVEHGATLTFFRSTNSFSTLARLLISSSYLKPRADHWNWLPATPA